MPVETPVITTRLIERLKAAAQAEVLKISGSAIDIRLSVTKEVRSAEKA